jgi:polyisoprenoid-binding protein YceI
MVTLGPGNAQVGLVAYALGLFPRSGHFDAFSGQLAFDPAHPDECRVTLHIDAASLRMASTLDNLARGPGLLDVAHYPDIAFTGGCGLRTAQGDLTLHGVTRRVSMAETRTAARLDAAGTLNRRDFGMTGWPGTIGATIAMHFTVNLPAALAASPLP